MNTFFRIAVYLSFAMIIFNLAIAFVGGLDNPNTGEPIFPVGGTPGRGMTNESESIEEYTDMGAIGLEDPTVGGMFTLIASGVLVATIFICILIRSITPLGIAIFGSVFWGAFYQAQAVISYGGYIPSDFITIFVVGGAFLFIAAIIGMLTGSG